MIINKINFLLAFAIKKVSIGYAKYEYEFKAETITTTKK